MGITPDADISNDTRGWIMCIVSALACVLGASIICVDLITTHVPRWRSFRIQQSDTFLAASLSLSFGVMIFSSLFSILPSSREYLESSGLSDTSAGLAMISSFGVGVVGIGAVSRFLHQFMPSHVVECDHEHSETETESETASSAVCHSHTPPDPPAHPHPLSRPPSETTPLLSRDAIAPSRPADGVRAQVMSFIQDTKANCDQTGPCYGYRDPCGNTCFKIRGRSLGRGQGKKKGRRLSVFLALLVHNIAEGFSLALPLYLALNSRPRAIIWSALLGGLSQPLGAGIAALWFRLASSAPSDAMYGLLFATTAGIMVGVGLQLFSEGLALRHDRDICAWFAFVGMALMGVSGCLVSH
ncbi:putative zinc transporter zip2 [Ceratocystis fimbriata CBS 114723]|uniref:Putative zinc transporter zip2 n=1 Tax=Ceratocystis fimbriata CBS 114723 TaxID=1035309 RepID=A0A2C5XEU8_9PEZI|nr:putative zinc transporter zip2 [Ceratocystis fimbriata CBS 114723]